MARLRAFTKNGGQVYDLFMKRKKEAINTARITKIDQQIIQTRQSAISQENFGNLVILSIGKKSWASQFLRSVRSA